MDGIEQAQLQLPLEVLEISMCFLSAVFDKCSTGEQGLAVKYLIFSQRKTAPLVSDAKHFTWPQTDPHLKGGSWGLHQTHTSLKFPLKLMLPLFCAHE